MRYKIFLSVLLVLLSINIVAADFQLGSNSTIDKQYGAAQIVRGWINISLQNEKLDSNLSAFNQNVNLMEFLEDNSAIYDCVPSDCESQFKSLTNSEEEIKIFNIKPNEKKIIGIKIKGELNADKKITDVSFKSQSNASSGCSQPLQIDILNDGKIEWFSDFSSEEFTCFASQGCFEESKSTEDNPIMNTDADRYCEKIKMPKSFPVIQAGANVIVVNTNVQEAQKPKLQVEIYGEKNGEKIGDCKTSVIQNSGEYSCIIKSNLSREYLSETEDVFACIKGSYPQPSNELFQNYKIKIEEADEICGFSGGIANSQNPILDYDIFIKGGKYDSLENKEILINDYIFKEYQPIHSSITLADYLNSYLNDRYGYNCSNECIIPISFSGGQSQQITLSDLALNYKTIKNPSISETKFVDVTETSAVINSDFIKLNLEPANFITPDTLGEKQFILSLGGKNILTENISVQAIPIVKDIIPHQAPALVPVTFNALLENSQDNSTYIWNFGDNSPTKTTNKNYVVYTYSNVGTYSITVNSSNEFGEFSKTVQVTIISPKEAISSTITKDKENLENIGRELNNLPGWIKQEVEKEINIDELNNEIKKQEAVYETASTDAEYIKIMENLLKLNIPYKLDKSQIVNNPLFFLDEEQLDLVSLKSLGAGKPSSEKKEYIKLINGWLNKNLDVSIDSETYSFYYEDKENKDIISYVKINLKPKTNADKIYLVIKGPKESIKFNSQADSKAVSDGIGVIISGLSEEKTIEFLYPGKIDSEKLPVYISPDFEKLGMSIEVGVCNFNKICEKELGEDYKNCRPDCKPLGSAILLLIGLFIITFISYIALQEWYKKNYESKLFPDRNQLFNLINFMNNAISQNLDKSELVNQLEAVGWNGEQITYAWRKLHGMRTGMWEIPLFKGSEKKEVRAELGKRPIAKPGMALRPPKGIAMIQPSGNSQNNNPKINK